MRTRGAHQTYSFLKLSLGTALLSMALIIQSVPSSVSAATVLQNRVDRLSDGTVGATATHVVSFTITDFTTPVGSIRLEFCANDPIPDFPCTPPPGFDASAAVLDSQAGETGFSIHPTSNTNRIILSRLPVLVTTADVEYIFNGIVNPSNAGTFYIRLQTFSSDDATGTAVQAGGIALAVNELFNVSAEVPPFLRFCAGITIVNFDCATADSFLIDLGEFSQSLTRSAQSEMVAVTNAPSGFSISLSGTTLTSGTNVIQELSTQTASQAGTSQFGMNLRSNASPPVGAEPVGPGIAAVAAAYNSPNQYRFRAGDVVASSTGPNDYRKFTVSYIANVDAAQPPGIYATTITFICLANF